MYRVAVCEDEPRLREELTGLCRKILQRLEVESAVVPYASAEALKDGMVRGERFDLLCLDILLPGENGMELARELRRRDDRTSILFITSSEEFLLEGYSVRPIQYLLKPVREAALEEALQTDLRLRRQPQAVVLQTGLTTSVVPLADILYVESRDHGTYVVSPQGETFFRISLEQMEQKLPRGQFCRCHRSFVVNLGRVRDVNSRGIVLDGGRWVPVSRTYLARFRQRFNDFLNEGNL